MLSGNDSGFDLMDDSLTDIRWLQRMDAGSGFPGLTHAQCRKKLAAKSNRSMGKDGCRKKLDYSSKKGTNKPPLSYASLIALAICSTPQRMMTLSSIYRWIEYTFPFYRTPEAKAWKNSIRHNLSIRKNMFMKVFQYPPRRGNGSYWTLLSDGEEELQKAVPLFATLQPPVIDSNSTYHREPSTHTVKSKGKFIPVLPRSNMSSGGLPYFSVGSNLPGSSMQMAQFEAANEVVIGESSSQRQALLISDHRDNRGNGKGSRVVGKHLREHSYAKTWCLKDGERVNRKSDGTLVVELASGRGGKGEERGVAAQWDQSIDSDESFIDPSPPTKKKRKLAEKSQPSFNTGDFGCGGSPSFSTPPKEQDNSLHLLDSSFLTPLKVDIGAISFSPLYTNLVTPKREVNRGRTTSETMPHSFLPSPLTPLRSSLDSGIFSPLHSDCLGGMKFSTPTNSSSLSPLADLSAFGSLHPELCPFRVMDNSDGCGEGATPLRPGSLQALGLPGLTPPS